jgi:AcrR family transcriptional regulator
VALSEQPVDRRAVRREAKWSNIVEQAWDLARRDGLAAISLRDLADRVDLRQPSLYAYFDSKLDLYDAMFADGNRQLLDFVETHTTPNDDPRQSLAEFVLVLVQFSSEDVVRHQLLFQRTIPGFEPSAASYAIALDSTNWAADVSPPRAPPNRATSICSPLWSVAWPISRWLTTRAVTGGPGWPRGPSRCF